MSKALEFKKRQGKDSAVRQMQDSNDLVALKKLAINLAYRVGQLEQRLEEAVGSAKVSDWRSLAILKCLDDHSKGAPFPGEAAMIAKSEKLQVESFDRESELDDAARKLEVHPGPAEDGLFAIAKVRLFKEGAEVHSSQVLRSKFEVGKAELLKEVDAEVLGMKPGDVKRFPLALAGQTDEAELTLYGLRKAPDPKPDSEPAAPAGQAQAAPSQEEAADGQEDKSS